MTGALAAHTDSAREIVTAAPSSGIPLDQAPEITAHLTAGRLRDLLDPANYLGHAIDLVDRALASRTTGGHHDRGRGNALHYELHGDPDAPPVLLLGSLGSDLHMWDPRSTHSRRTIV